MTMDEIKNRISMELKDPTLQQGFEIICKENVELKLDLKALEEANNITITHCAKVNDQLWKAKDIIKRLMNELVMGNLSDNEIDLLIDEVEQFCSKVKQDTIA